jgi:hypothetical protein
MLVTTERTRTLLAERHGAGEKAIEILPQGFDAAFDPSAVSLPDGLPPPPEEGLEMVFTGTLYAGLRDPRPLLAALGARPADRLLIAGASIGLDLSALQPPPNVIFLGKLRHQQVLALQRRAAVLVNIGNNNAEQVPGKLFEYFGAQRPVLHLRQHSEDASAGLLERLRRGRVVENRAEAIVAAIADLAARKAAGHLDEAFDLSPMAVAQWSWETLGLRLEQLCAGLVA